MTLAEGVCLRMDSWKQEENRLITLLLKGVLVYLIVMGGIGCYLSALDIRCMYPLIHVVVLAAAMFCAVLYYNKIWENAGYFVLLFVMSGMGVAFGDYISSGVFAVANQLGERAAVFFDSSAVRSYAEQISDRYLSVTISMCYVGWVCCILMNVLISRRMQYAAAVPLVIGMLLIPLYIEQEPSPLYVAMLLSGLIASYSIRGNGHYGISRKNTCYEYRRKKRAVSYVYAGKTMASVILLVFLLCLCLTQILSVIYPENRFRDRQKTSSMKEATMDTMGNFMLLGFMGLFNYYPNTGGLTSGRLGGVNAIRLDYETDLTVEYAPCSDSRLYLKTFTGADYRPYYNSWQRRTDAAGQALPDVADSTVSQRKKAFERGEKGTARAKMAVTNVEAETGAYLPYYSADVDVVVSPGETREYVFYPQISERIYEPEERGGDWLEVPEENRGVIAEFCREAGLERGDVKEIVKKLTDYFRDNIPYTIRPGATPYRQDFVNYFLGKSKKGYCAHFASSATLILRYLGIPARYAEGYAIDPGDLAEDGAVLPDKNYSDYYEGDNPVGQTAVVSVDVTDASAHAWVEILDPEQGWQVIEFTPPSAIEREEGVSLWQRLADLLAGGRDEPVREQGAGGTPGAPDIQGGRGTAMAFALVAALAVFAVGVCLMARKIRGMILYARADRNEQLLMDYRKYIRKMGRKEPEMAGFVNFRQQVQHLSETGAWQISREEEESCVRILEQAAFSERGPGEEEIGKIYRLIRR